MSRRHAAGASSARGLLFTILGEYVLPDGGSAWTSAIIETMSRLGVEEKATRQALMRTAADGWLTPERVGTADQVAADAERQTGCSPRAPSASTASARTATAGTAPGCWCWRGRPRPDGRPGTCCAAA